ncbi:MAG: redoxin domain-containing protein [Anaerolineae bacterium]
MPKWLEIRIEPKGEEREARAREKRAVEAEEARGGKLRWVLLGVALVALLVAGAWFLRIWSQKATTISLPDVVARVNGEEITRQDLERMININRALYPIMQGREMVMDETSLRQFQIQVLDQIIDNRLILQEAAKAGTTVSEAEVEAELASFRNQIGVSESQLEAQLARVGLGQDALRSWMREELTRNRFLATNVLQGSAAEQQQTYKAWLNDLQARAQVEIYLSSATAGRVAKVGSPAPDFTLPDLEGQPVSLSRLKGQPVMINFWATWCPPCRFEMPLIEAAYQKYKDQGFVVVAVDVQEPQELVEAFVQRFGLSFPVVLDSAGEVSSIYRVRGLPRSFFVDREGVIRAMKAGALLREEELEGYLADILPAEEASP